VASPGFAAAQKIAGTFVDARESVEKALQANPDELVYRPEALKLRGELSLKLRQTELAAADFREAIALHPQQVRQITGIKCNHQSRTIASRYRPPR
jgi:Tfp pilus assembly protein PilF